MPPAARPGPASQEGYPSSSSSLDAHSNDPFNSATRPYYDNESDPDTSNSPGNDYDNNDNYEYRESSLFLASPSLVSFLPPQPNKTPTPILMCTNVQPPHQSR